MAQNETDNRASVHRVVHTPGPWIVKRHIDNVTGKPYQTLYESHLAVEPDVCAVWAPPQNAEREANAQLIAAAPELLEACKAFLDMWHRAGPLGSHQFEKFDGVVRKCSMAVEKATGEVV